MNPYAIHAADVFSLQTEMGADCPTATINGTKYNILPGSAAYNTPLRDGGFTQIYDLTITLAVAQFNQAIPALSAMLLAPAIVIYTGINYKCENIHVLPGATLIRLACNSLHQNA